MGKRVYRKGEVRYFINNSENGLLQFKEFLLEGSSIVQIYYCYLSQLIRMNSRKFRQITHLKKGFHLWSKQKNFVNNSYPMLPVINEISFQNPGNQLKLIIFEFGNSVSLRRVSINNFLTKEVQIWQEFKDFVNCIQPYDFLEI